MRILPCTQQKALWIRENVEKTARKALEKDGFRDTAYLAGRPLSQDRDPRKDRVHLTNDFGQETTGLRLSDPDLIVTNVKVRGGKDGGIRSARIAVEDIYEPSSTVILEKSSKGELDVYTARYSRSEGPLGLTQRRSIEKVVFDRSGNQINSGLGEADLQKLRDWTDPKAVEQLDLEQAEARIASIATLFKQRGDKRGIFPSGYLSMTKETLRFINELPEGEAEKARTLATDFAQRYFQGLGDHLRGRPNQAWDTYYAHAAGEGASPVQVFLAGATAHLVHDLPHSIVAAGMRGREDKKLFMEWGTRLSDSTTDLVKALADDHQVDAKAFQVSRSVRALIFGAMRENAWSNADAFFRDEEKLGTEIAAGKLRTNAHSAHLQTESLRSALRPAVVVAGLLGSIGLQLDN